MVKKLNFNIKFVTILVSRINADAHNSATQGL